MKAQPLILLLFFCLTGNILFGQQFSYDNNAGLFPKKNKKHKYGYVNQNGKQIIKYQFDYAETFSEGFAAVVIDGKFDFIDQAVISLLHKNLILPGIFLSALLL